MKTHRSPRAKRYPIAVRRYLPGRFSYSKHSAADPAYLTVDTVRRTLRAEAIGNFCPLFCRYAGNPRVLVHSDAGDLSDPFRRTDDYAAALFIVADPVTEAEAAGLKTAGLL